MSMQCDDGAFESSPMIPEVVDLCALASGSPYAPQAFAFVQDGLRFTGEQLFDDVDQLRDEGDDTHVSGRDLALGLRDFAIERYGLLARPVLQHWNVHRTDDFGRIVFEMIESGLLSRQDQDSIEDFYGVYAFDEAFDHARILNIIDQEDDNEQPSRDLVAGHQG